MKCQDSHSKKGNNRAVGWQSKGLDMRISRAHFCFFWSPLCVFLECFASICCRAHPALCARGYTSACIWVSMLEFLYVPSCHIQLLIHLFLHQNVDIHIVGAWLLPLRLQCSFTPSWLQLWNQEVGSFPDTLCKRSVGESLLLLLLSLMVLWAVLPLGGAYSGKFFMISTAE